MIAQVNAKGSRTVYGRRKDGRVTLEAAPNGTATGTAGDFETSYEYDRNGDLKSWTMPRAAGEYGPAQLKVSYTRDPVGNPTTITDARGRAITNVFYDTGELIFTSRTSWWVYDQGEDRIREKTPQELMAAADPARLPESEGHGDFGEVTPEPMPGVLPIGGGALTFHDREMRPIAIVDAAVNVTELQRDALGRIRERIFPFDQTPEAGPCGTYNAGDSRIREQLRYDLNGNLRSAEGRRGLHDGP